VLDTVKQFISNETAGNRWHKVNLHVHGEGSDPHEIVRQARHSEIDLIAITDHQAFSRCDAVLEASHSPGRPLAVLPGIEITAQEGVHILAIFPPEYSPEQRTRFLGWLGLTGTGDTRIASNRNLADILQRIDDDGGIVVVPHPFTQGIGLLDGARKLSTKKHWLESGHIRLVQIADDKVKYLDRDAEGNWSNRYVLASARTEDIRSSKYCLAPFNRTDAQTPEEIGEGCSWFRMAQLSVEGLKQVACEPRTRISRTPPPSQRHDRILGMRVTGGYCDGQLFRFNEALNCVVGQNYAGKSAVLDFVRFALGHEGVVQKESRENLLSRLNGILGPEGTVELYLRHAGDIFVVKRAFNPKTSGQGPTFKVESCLDAPLAYRFDFEQNTLLPIEDFTFPIDVYEQGRISRLREDVSRQLDMLDEFGNLREVKEERTAIVLQLNESAGSLRPLYEEREQLKSDVGNLPQLKQELAEKEQLLPGEEEQRWAKASTLVQTIEGVVGDLGHAIANIPDPQTAVLHERRTDLGRLFGQKAPSVSLDEVIHPEILRPWIGAVQAALADIENARGAVIATVQRLKEISAELQQAWEEESAKRDRRVSEQLARAGVESPKEVIDRVAVLRREIAVIETTKQPRLAEVEADIDRKEIARETLLNRLEGADREITVRRQEKARELTDALDGQIQITITAASDKTDYARILDELYERIATRDRRIQNREGQLNRVVNTISPIDLARALLAKGNVRDRDGTTQTLRSVCDITENTQNVLCRIADNIELLNRLETVAVPDVPQILVRRRGESTYADLRTGLSPGEQSAAILTLALQTRTRPLILDQPEDELGYSYVVHLIVPKILQAKFSRQLLVVTHNANIPVLGDADYVTKMENRPHSDPARARQCVIAAAGCFESPDITDSLIELEGGQQAFQFRQHRYALPRHAP
jgi:hypothetical protein